MSEILVELVVFESFHPNIGPVTLTNGPLLQGLLRGLWLPGCTGWMASFGGE